MCHKNHKANKPRNGKHLPAETPNFATSDSIPIAYIYNIWREKLLRQMQVEGGPNDSGFVIYTLSIQKKSFIPHPSQLRCL